MKFVRRFYPFKIGIKEYYTKRKYTDSREKNISMIKGLQRIYLFLKNYLYLFSHALSLFFSIWI